MDRRDLKGILAPLLALLFLVFHLHVEAAPHRVALIIGNAAYPGVPLKNPANDAADMAERLRAMGFVTIVQIDATRQQFKDSVKQFLNTLTPESEALFFYAGHALQIKGVNYLLATDFDIKEEDDIPEQSLDVDALLQKLEAKRTRVNIIILDACRNDPFARTVGRGGLASMNATASGTLIAFATAPGRVAQDGTGRNGLFTKHLLQAMSAAGMKIEDVLKRVRIGVGEESGGQQVPWENSSLQGDFYFVPPSQQRADPTPAPSQSAEARRSRDAIQTGTRAAALEYLRQYPQGEHRAAVVAHFSALSAASELRQTVAVSHLRDCPQCPPVVLLPDNADTTGHPDRDPGIGAFEVTVAEYQACVEAGACKVQPVDVLGNGSHPAINVRYVDAKRYADWISKLSGRRYRLPSAAEWQRAAVLGQVRPDSNGKVKVPFVPCQSGNGYDQLAATVTSYSWSALHCNDGFSLTAPVGLFHPNFLGVFDMFGNVWEWTESCALPSKEGTQRCDRHLLKGGSWASPLKALSPDATLEAEPTLQGEIIGFRLYRVAPDSP